MKASYRYIKPVIKTTAVIALFGFVTLAAAPCWNDLSPSRAATEKPQKEPAISDENVDPENKFDYAGTDYLKKDAYPEINELMRKYYDASLAVDMDAFVGLVSDPSQIDAEKLVKQLDYLEGIDNIICYTVDGDIEGTYRVYVYYDMKIKGIDMPAPALYAFYVTMSSDGNYIVYLSGLDGETQDFLSAADTSSDVQTLKALVNERFQNIMEKDEKMKEFYDMLDSGMLPSDAVSGGAIGAEGETPDAGGESAPEVQEPGTPEQQPESQPQDVSPAALDAAS